MAHPLEKDPTLERKDVEDALRASEARYRRLFETAQDGILILDAHSGLIIDVNPFLITLLDYPREDFLGKALWDIGPFKQIQESKEAFRELQDKQYIRYENLPLESRSGRRVNVEFVSNVYGVNGDTVIQCNIRDITARKKAEQDLAAKATELARQAEELAGSRHALEDKSLTLQSVLDSMSEGLVVADVQGKFIIWNPAAERIVGVGPANMLTEEWTGHYGLFLPDMVTPFPSEKTPLARAIQGESSSAVMFVRNPNVDEGVFVEAYASPLKDKDGTVRGGVVAFRDITGRIQAEGKLREYERVVESLEDMILVLDREYRYVIANRAFLNYRARKKEQVIGHRVDEILERETFETVVKEKMDECFQGRVVQFELDYTYPDRAARTLYTSYFPIEGPQGIDRIACILRDITERKRSEEALRESERQFRTLGDSIPQLTWMANPDGWIFWYNQRWYEYTGTTVEQMQGWGWQSVLDPVELPGVMERWQTSIANGDPFDMVFPLRGADGVLRPFLTRVMPVKGGEGQIVRWFGTNTDITEQKRTEEALRKSEERFSKAFRSSPLAITIATAAEGRYLDVNDAFLNMVGHNRAGVIGRTSLDLNLWAEKSQRFEMLRQLREGGRVTGFRTQHKTLAGEIRETEVSADLIELEGQTCVLAIIRDITETLKLEAQFRQAQKMEAVGRLAGGVAHDFNNMMGVIIGYSDLSLGLIAPESPANRYMEQIKKAAHRAVALTRQLLAFSRQQVVFPKILDLNEVVQNVTTMLQRLVGEDVAMSFRPAVPIGSINADPGQIEQILMNLVVNARDAMPGGGEIVIETGHAELDQYYVSQHPGSHSGQHVVLAVSDTGCGMDENIKSKIFEPFFTTKGVGQGTGLGLSTVYGIVKQDGGTIFVYSEPGKGTTFKIYFPRAAGKAEPLEQPHAESEFPGGSETILVAEDDLSLRELTVSLLQNAGYQVVEASNAEAALDILKASEREIDLLLTDVIMPGKSGIELLEYAKVIRPNLRSLFVSGYTGDLVALRGGAVPEAAFLEKPFTRDSLLKKVHSALHS